MPYDSVLLVKQVPDTANITAEAMRDDGTVNRGALPTIFNPEDLNALEAALETRDRFGGTITALTMGPPKAEKELKEAVAMGCDEAVFLCAREFAGADTWATAYALSAAIRQVGDFDIVLCGKQAMDGDTGQVGPGIANQLGVPQLTYVSKIRSVDLTERTIQVERLLEEGREVVETSLPALLTVVKDINTPRYPTFRGIRRARRLQVPTWTSQDLPGVRPDLLGLDGSPTKVVKVFSPPRREGAVEMLEHESPDELASILADKLIEDKVV